MIYLFAMKYSLKGGVFCLYEMRLKRRHSSIKYATCSRHLFVVTSLFFLFFFAWVLFICGIGESIIKTVTISNNHWMAGFSLSKSVSQVCPQNTCSLAAPVHFLQRNALPSLHPPTLGSRPSAISITRPLLIAQTFLLETLLVLQSVFHLTWLSLTCCFYYCIMGIPCSAEHNVFYVGNLEYLLND